MFLQLSPPNASVDDSLHALLVFHASAASSRPRAVLAGDASSDVSETPANKNVLFILQLVNGFYRRRASLPPHGVDCTAS